MKVKFTFRIFYNKKVSTSLNKLRQNKSIDRILFNLTLTNKITINKLRLSIFKVHLDNISPESTSCIIIQSFIQFFFIIKEKIDIIFIYKLKIFYLIYLKSLKILWFMPIDNKAKFTESMHFHSNPVVLLWIYNRPITILKYFRSF